MKTKHTPGKWYYWVAASTSYIDGPDGALIAAVHTEDGAEAKANARLIAAAPSLLDALAELTSAASMVWEILGGDRDKQEAWVGSASTKGKN